MNWLQALLGIGKKPKQPTQNGFALCVGLNAVNPNFYEGWDGKLNACENDANAMQHYLTSRGFHVTKLLTAEATCAAVLLKLRDYATLAQPGDTVVFTNSSHGGQVPDYDNTEADRMDETICMYDGQIIDDSLEAAWARFKPGVRLVFVSDSCHSGTVARAAFSAHTRYVNTAEGSKAMPMATQLEVAAANNLYYRVQKEEAQRAHSEIAASVLALGACQDNQTALDGTVNGAFTGALLDVLRGSNTLDYGRTIVAVRRALPPSQTPSYTYAGPRLYDFEHSPAFSI